MSARPVAAARAASCSATRAVGNGMATTPISRIRLMMSSRRSTFVIAANMAWWLIHMMPMVRKLTA